MKRLLYIMSAILLVACVKESFPDVDYGSLSSGAFSEIYPAAYVDPATLPPGATKALVDVGTVVSMEANALRIDEKKGNDDFGTYEYESWEQAYITEATVASSPSVTGLRSMFLNPVQTYDYKPLSQEDTIFYHTRMISWYPRTCTLHKNDQGKATVMKFYDFNNLRNKEAYDLKNDGKVALKFKGLDGSKDVMVSNIAEGQHWHANRGDQGHDRYNGTDTYTYPFGHSNAHPIYSNSLTYKHYMAAVKVYARADASYQDVAMWGALRKVYVKNQPSEVSVILPDPGEMEDVVINGNVQANSLDYGSAEFSGKVDFQLLKTPMFGSDVNDPANQEVAEDAPYLVQGTSIYLGYALIKPNVGEDGQKLELDVHTDAGVLSVAVPMTQTVTENDAQVQKNYFLPGYIYNIEIRFNTEGAIAGIVMQSGDEHYYDLSAGSEFDGGVHELKYANCYIVSPDIQRELSDGSKVYYDGYAFTATTVGNGNSGLYSDFSSDRTSVKIDPVRAGLLWESTHGLITQVEYLYGYVRFKVQPPQVKDSNGDWTSNGLYKEGNAVIAVYDSRRMVLWSWHIWVTDNPKDVSYSISAGEGTKTIKLMDRNLGATADRVQESDTLLATYGLYYQWGRKDPSMGPPSAHYLPQSTATMNYYDYYGYKWDFAGVVTLPRPTVRDGVENPMYLVLPTDFSMTTYQYDWLYTNIDNLWGDYSQNSEGSTSRRMKTIYDPCPFGYMVPQDEISTLFTKGSDIGTDGRFISGKLDNGNSYSSFFPFAGYKGVDKGVSSLTCAWRYVGKKGDYMSSKIDPNGHRSRAYISENNYWVEYGADADNDGDGDASRTYNAYVYADDVANRRTAASVRCVRRESALNSALAASFVGDRLFAFVGDGQINFTYDVEAMMADGIVKSAYIDLNGETLNTDADGNNIANLSGETKHISGEVSFSLPVDYGVYRYRLVSESSNGAVSRIGYVLRMFAAADLKVKGTGEAEYSAYNKDGYKYDYGKTYDVAFTLNGSVSDYSVQVNGVVATRNGYTGTEDKASMSYTVSGIKVPGHIHIQILNAEGQLVCEKTYDDLPMNEVQQIFSITGKSAITNTQNLAGGAMYVIRTYYTVANFGSKQIYLVYDANTKSLKTSTLTDTGSIPAEFVFRFHKGGYTTGGNNSFANPTAGAWVTQALGTDNYLNQNFGFGPEAGSIYTTCANNMFRTDMICIFLNDTNTTLIYDTDGDLSWIEYKNDSNWRWQIIPVDMVQQ